MLYYAKCGSCCDMSPRGWVYTAASNFLDLGGSSHLTYNIKTTNTYTKLQLTWELLVRFPLTEGLSSCIKIFRSLESLHIYHIEHLNTKTITIQKHHFHTLHSSTFYLSGRLEGSHMIYMR